MNNSDSFFHAVKQIRLSYYVTILFKKLLGIQVLVFLGELMMFLDVFCIFLKELRTSIDFDKVPQGQLLNISDVFDFKMMSFVGDTYSKFTLLHRPKVKYFNWTDSVLETIKDGQLGNVVLIQYLQRGNWLV